jgi:hypothetical protein
VWHVPLSIHIVIIYLISFERENATPSLTLSLKAGFYIEKSNYDFFIEFSTTKLLNGQQVLHLRPTTFQNHLSAPSYYSLIECFPTVPRVWQWLWRSQHDKTKTNETKTNIYYLP